MSTYSKVKSRQFGDIDSITFQGYQLQGKEKKIRGQTLLPYVGCLCVQDSPENPCPCTNDIFWIDKNAIIAKTPIRRTSEDGVEIEEISIKETSDVRLESMTVISSSEMENLIKRRCGSFGASPLVGDSLTIEDHTTLVLIAMEHFGAILSKTRALRGTPVNRELGITEPLAAFAVSTISTRRIRDVAAHAVKLCKAMEFDLSDPPKETTEVLVRLDEIFRCAKGFDDIEYQLRGLTLEHREDSPLRIGLQVGLDMLIAGKNTIYSPTNRYHRTLADMTNEGLAQDNNGDTVTIMSKKGEGAKQNAKDIGKADVAGAVVGGAAGAAAGGIGAGPGAVAGGVTASFTTSVVKAVDAVLSWF